ncbi:PH domain-containing protein [Chryseobacterium sp.]|uniref:PH domain-containing protein n=1 Tax=Chryseobacterium sp. TaxID=1871047 RepID=UPI0011CADF03|nr:PH domain-containing protein [Chryseobacterium sp.]TXF79602.1 hypothetical protein FUA25_04255 [Chryseobacterium sp.]
MKAFPTAGMDRATAVYSVIFGVICAGVVATLLFFGEKGEMALVLIPAVVLVAATVTAYLMIPKISVGDGKVMVKNTFVNIVFPVVSITRVERYEKVGFNIRTFGVGGVFGYFGYFNGNDVWYVTNIRKKVKITLKTGKVYMVSPEDPDGFIDEILNMKATFH